MSEITLLAAVTAFTGRRHGHFIDGRAVPGEENDRFAVINPASGEEIARVSEGGKAEADAAMDAAATAFCGAWAQTSPAERGNCLNRLADLFQAHREELAQIESLCSGKTIQLARMLEIDMSVQFLRYFAGWASKISGETVNVSLPSFAGEKYSAFTRREPVGVVAGIIPWNFSIMIAVWKLAAALSCGCTIVLKPSEYTPLTMLRVAELAAEAGIPPGVLNVVNGSGARLGPLLTEHPRCAKVTFTGSVPTGIAVGTAATANGLKRVTLELGGKNGAAFLADLSPEKMVDGIIEAGYLNQGQICAAAERFFIPNSHLEQVLVLLSARLDMMKVGSPLDEETQVGPLANRAHFDKVMGLIARAQQEGNRIVCGGRALSGPGFFVAPTAIVAGGPDDALMREETFGPVGTFLGYDDESQLVALMNDSPYGLAASLWTNDLSKALRMIDGIEAGTVWVNMHTFLDPALPFGGVKASGIGREFGSAFIEHYTELKSVMIRY